MSRTYNFFKENKSDDTHDAFKMNAAMLLAIKDRKKVFVK